MPSVVLDLRPPRDMRELVELIILESGVGSAGPYHIIETVTDIGVYPDYIKQYVTDLAEAEADYFMVQWRDDKGALSETSIPVQGGTNPSEIMASLDDVNANLDGSVVKAATSDIDLIQISVARIIRGYLSRVITLTTLHSWSTPAATPEIIREVAGKLIAAQLYITRSSRSELEMTDQHYAQRLYDAAMEILNQIIAGDIKIDDITLVDDTASLTTLDFWPVDSTDRAFTLGQQF